MPPQTNNLLHEPGVRFGRTLAIPSARSVFDHRLEAIATPANRRGVMGVGVAGQIRIQGGAEIEREVDAVQRDLDARMRELAAKNAALAQLRAAVTTTTTTAPWLHGDAGTSVPHDHHAAADAREGEGRRGRGREGLRGGDGARERDEGEHGARGGAAVREPPGLR